MNRFLSRLSYSLIGFTLIFSSCKNSTDIMGLDESLIRISPRDLKVGEKTIIHVEITSPEGGIAVGGGLLFPFYMKPWNGLMKGVSEDKKSNSLVTAIRSDGGKVEVFNDLVNPQWDILSDMKVYIRETPLSEGETLTIQFGNEGQKVVVARKQLSLYLELEIDAEGEGENIRLKPPVLPVAEAGASKLYLVAPSHVVAGEEFEVVVYGEDKHSNVCEKYTGELVISKKSDSDGEDINYKMHEWDPSKSLDRNHFSYTIDNTGIFYLQAIDNKNELAAISNPIVASKNKPEKNLFWGEVHVHSQISDGRGELQDVYRDGYARGLDFIAITDHGFGRDKRGTLEERIRVICKEADRFNKPGEFVAIPAGETHYLPVMHMNMYFDEADPEKMMSLANSIDSATKDLRKEWRSMSPDQLAESVIPYWDIFKSEIYKNHTLVFPHHTMWLGIKPFLDAERTRVVEVYSVHGTSEIRNQDNTPKPLQMKPDRVKGDLDRKISAREILNDGIRFGFAGGSDNHEGQAGSNAITGVYGNELTRASIIRGIYNKECYATSSNRTLIDLKTSEGKYICMVAGDGEIDKVEVICNGEVVFKPVKIDGRVCKFEWTPETADGYFYVKVLLENGKEAAWSSPIWF
ncbi:hypothetical protein ACFLU5_00045 [Bacteroidota bacterium]